MFKKIKSWLTSPANEKRLLGYAKVGISVFGLAAIGSAEHVASLHEPITWSVVFGVAAAGAKAVFDLVEPIIVGWFTKTSAGA